MALVEIDETELSNYRKLAETYNKALTNPKSRPLLIDAIAEVDERVAQAPDRIIRREVDERFGAINTKLDEFLTAFKTERETDRENQQRRELEQNLNAGREIARRSGYDADGLKVLEEFKAEQGILDYGDAIAAYERRFPPPTPVATGGNRWDFLSVPESEAPDLKPLLESNGDSEAWLNKTIQQTLRDVRSQR
jgi:hypothetical protein